MVPEFGDNIADDAAQHCQDGLRCTICCMWRRIMSTQVGAVQLCQCLSSSWSYTAEPVCLIAHGSVWLGFSLLLFVTHAGTSSSSGGLHKVQKLTTVPHLSWHLVQYQQLA